MASSDTVFWAVYLMAHDKDFARQHTNIRPALFPKGAMRYIVDLSQRIWQDFSVPLNDQRIDVMLQETSEEAPLRRNGVDADQVRDAYRDLCAGYTLVPEDWPMARQTCRNWLEQRAMTLATQEASDLTSKGRLDDAQKAMSRGILPTASAGSTVLNAGSVDFLKTMRTPKPGAVPTGIAEIDALWDGGYRPGELGMIVAPTGVGKSMILSMLAARAFWADATVAYYTYELTRDQIRDRIALGILEKGRHDTNDQWDKELEGAAKRRHLNKTPDAWIEIRDSENASTWPELVADLEYLKDKYGNYPDVLLLDSADDLAPISKRERTHESLKDAYVFLRQMALRKGMRIWSTGQLTRESVDKARVNLKHIGDAFAKVQKSHYCLGFSQTQQDKDDPDGPWIHLYILKDSENGTTGGWLQCKAQFGNGRNGYAGIDVDSSSGLPSVYASDPRDEEEDDFGT